MFNSTTKVKQLSRRASHYADLQFIIDNSSIERIRDILEFVNSCEREKYRVSKIGVDKIKMSKEGDRYPDQAGDELYPSFSNIKSPIQYLVQNNPQCQMLWTNTTPCNSFNF